MTDRTEVVASAPVTKAILTMSIPVVLGMMVSMLYNLVDTFFIGKLHDQNQLSAANIAAPVSMLMMAVATIVSTGAASYISRCLDQKDKETAHKSLSTGVAICVGLGLALMSLGILFLKPLLFTLGATPETYQYVNNYVFVMLIGTVPVMLSYTGGQLVRAEGAPMPAMTGSIKTIWNTLLVPYPLWRRLVGRGAASEMPISLCK